MEKRNFSNKPEEISSGDSLYHPLKIGSLKLQGNLLLAPLAGFTDRAFRSLAIEMGANLTFTEMVSCEAVARGNAKTLPLMERADQEELLAIQLFTGSLDSMERCLEGVLAFNPSLIDLNCGCPVPKVIKTGAGSALMKDPELLFNLVKVMKSTGKPVSVKIRSGWDHHSQNFKEVALAAQEAGADLLTLHARTRSQGYSGKADWSQLKTVKSLLTIPVAGSGDLFSAQDGRDMLKETGIDALMFARGALGNPFVFRETETLLKKGESLEPPSMEEKINTALEHFHRAVYYDGEGKTCKEIRKHLCYYSKGLPSGKELRNKLIHCKTSKEYEKEFQNYLAAKPVEK